MSTIPVSWEKRNTISLFLQLGHPGIVVDVTFSKFLPTEDYLQRRQLLADNRITIYISATPISGDELEILKKRTVMLFDLGSYVISLASGTVIWSGKMEHLCTPEAILKTAIAHFPISTPWNSDAVLLKLKTMYDRCYLRSVEFPDPLPIDWPLVSSDVLSSSTFLGIISPTGGNIRRPGPEALFWRARSGTDDVLTDVSDAVSEASSATLRDSSPEIPERAILGSLPISWDRRLGRTPRQRRAHSRRSRVDPPHCSSGIRKRRGGRRK